MDRCMLCQRLRSTQKQVVQGPPPDAPMLETNNVCHECFLRVYQKARDIRVEWARNKRDLIDTK